MRTSYFPGQGWLLRSQLWDEISSIWPINNFDTWMRLPDISHGKWSLDCSSSKLSFGLTAELTYGKCLTNGIDADRDCIAPEVNRIRMIDSAGPHQQNMTWHTKTVCTCKSFARNVSNCILVTMFD